MPYGLNGRRVLVTGGSRGLGALICEKFAMAGACVMVNYVSRKDKADEVVGKIRNYGVEAYSVQGVSLSIITHSGTVSTDLHTRMQGFGRTTFAW